MQLQKKLVKFVKIVKNPCGMPISDIPLRQDWNFILFSKCYEKIFDESAANMSENDEPTGDNLVRRADRICQNKERTGDG